MNLKLRNSFGFTLPFALALTFIFSGLVGVSYMFVSINLRQMQSNLWAAQAVVLAEGINERVKARMNSKSKIQLSPDQEDKLSDPSLADEADKDEEEDDDEVEDEFNEQTEDFDEYYADEILKISRYITFKEPPEEKKKKEEASLVGSGRPDDSRPKDAFSSKEEEEVDPEKLKPEANVDKIGNIKIPEGTILDKKTKLVIFKDEKLSLKLDDIINPIPKPYMNRLPVPKIKSLSPNYSEPNKRSSTIIIGENYPKGDPYFNEKGIVIEEIKSGPQFDFLILMSVKPGMKRLMWGSAQAEFYIIPPYDGSLKPNIEKAFNSEGNELLDIVAGKRGEKLKVTGTNLFLNKAKPVAIGDVNGVYPRVKDFAQNGNELTLTLDVGRNVEPGVHSITIATEGGLSNTWLFNVLPPLDREEIKSDSATFSTSLTLLDIMVVDKVLPLINDGTTQNTNMQNDPGRPVDPNNQDPSNPDEPEELTEEQKVGKFGNTDLETVWLLETSVMIGNSTKTISEVVHRELPLINAALTCNSKVVFEGGSFPINSATGASTMLVEPTYLSNTHLIVEGPPEEPVEPIAVPDTSPNSGGGPSGGRPGQNQQGPKTPLEAGFKEGSYVAVYKDGEKIRELDYALIHMLGRNTIDLLSPGLMDYHYANDSILQFIPPIISREKLSDDDSQFHTNPQGFSLVKSNSALFKNLFNSNLDQFAEVADLYTNDPSVPLDEFDLPQGYMGLTYVEGTPKYDQTNVLTGKGLFIIDTRPGNLGKPVGDVEFGGDSKSPVDFKGIIYVHGNLKVNGNLNVTGALIVDNEPTGELSFASNSAGMITYDYQYIKQAILSIPFTTKPGTVMISSKPIDLSDYAQGASASSEATQETASTSSNQTQENNFSMTVTTSENKTPEKLPEEALIETTQPTNINSGKKTAEEDLIDLF